MCAAVGLYINQVIGGYASGSGIVLQQIQDLMAAGSLPQSADKMANLRILEYHGAADVAVFPNDSIASYNYMKTFGFKKVEYFLEAGAPHPLSK